MASSKRTVNSQMPKGHVSVNSGGGRTDSNFPPFDQPRSSGGQNDMPNKFFDDLGGRAGATARAEPAKGQVGAGFASPGRGKGMPAPGKRRFSED